MSDSRDALRIALTYTSISVQCRLPPQVRRAPLAGLTISILTQDNFPHVVLRALNISYESKYLAFDKGEQKGSEHIAFNPNGRIPTSELLALLESPESSLIDYFLI